MPNANNPWTTTGSREIYKNLWIKVREDSVIRPDGKAGIYSVVEMLHAVFVIALNTENEVCLIRNYRYPTQQSTIELPSGGIEEGEGLLDAARKELAEETGFTASEWEQLGHLNSCSGVVDDKMHVFIARELQQTGENHQLEEGINGVEFVSWKKLLEMVKSGEINQGQSVSAIMLAYLHLDSPESR